MCNTTHSYLWHKFCVCVPWLIPMWHDAFTWVIRIIRICGITNPIRRIYVRHMYEWVTAHVQRYEWFGCVISLMCTCPFTHSYLWYHNSYKAYVCETYVRHITHMNESRHTNKDTNHLDFWYDKSNEVYVCETYYTYEWVTAHVQRHKSFGCALLLLYTYICIYVYIKIKSIGFVMSFLYMYIYVYMKIRLIRKQDTTPLCGYLNSGIFVTWRFRTCTLTDSYVTTQAYLWHDFFVRVPWLIPMWHDAFICVIRIIRICDATYLDVSLDSCICVICLTHVVCEARPIQICRTTHSNVRHLIYVWGAIWLIYARDMTHLRAIYVQHDSFMCGTWRIYVHF